MARLIDENFEGTGYEESWTETMYAGNTLDEDSTIPGTPPTGSGSQCLKAIMVAGTNLDAYTTRVVSNQNIIYARAYVYFETEGFNNTETSGGILRCNNSAVALAFRIIIGQNSGVFQARLDYYSASAIQSTAWVNISLGQWYRFEVQYDITNNLWEWRIDGTTQHSGSLSANTRIPYNLIVGILTTTSSGTTTTYTDLVAWDDTTWVGAESAGLSIPVAMNQYRQRWA